MSRIQALLPHTIAQLQSSKHITSLQGVIAALVENSLDASSSKIDISLDFTRDACTVEDNGAGIPSAEFNESGGLAKMYHTSKHAAAQFDLHGRSGTYLASLAALSLLTIKSKRHGDKSSSTLRVHHSRVIARGVESPSGEEMFFGTASNGTQVIVHDLFGNIPVRVKQRAVITERSSVDDKAWYELRRSIVGLLLAWHRPCSVRIKDSNDPRRNFILSAHHPTTSNALTEKSLNMLSGPKVKFNLQDSVSILTQAGLAAPESRLKWVPVSASSLRISVKGLINLDPAPTRQCQFVAVGIYPCLGTAVETVYDAINKVFRNSGFGCVEEEQIVDVDDVEKDRRKRDRRYKSDGHTQKQLHGRKSVDKWPMFVLQVFSTDSKKRIVDAESIGDMTLKVITDMLEITVLQWLETHHFRPHRRRRRRNEGQTVPSSTSSPVRAPITKCTPPSTGKKDSSSATSMKRVPTDGLRAASKRRKYVDMNGNTRYLDERPATTPARSDYFSSWSRVKSGGEGFYGELEKNEKLASPAKAFAALPPLEMGALRTRQETANPGEERPSTVSGGMLPITQTRQAPDTSLSSDDFGSMDDETLKLAADAAMRHGIHDAPPTDDIIEWTDPVTKQSLRLNSRTGVVLPAMVPAQPCTILEGDWTRPESRQAAAINTTLSSKGQCLTLSRRPRTASKTEDTQWLPGFLKEWKNPVFAPQREEHIPVTCSAEPGLEAPDHLNNRCTLGKFPNIGASVTARISRAALRSAKIIRQVDRKFILCKLSSGDAARNDDTLVLVDQHAASERVILESLLAQLCSPAETTVSVFKSITVKVQTQCLLKALRYQISSIEHELFCAHAQHFADWGIIYDLIVQQEKPSSSQVRPEKEEYLVVINYLPPVIAERGAQLPNLIIELLRSEIHDLPPSRKDTSQLFDQDNRQHGWLSSIGSCPKGLLDMLNSRACRSAIMFNDELSMDQCEELMEKLVACAFPFICAHGRVSMVPLVEVEEVGSGLQGFGGGGELVSDLSKFEVWLDRR